METNWICLDCNCEFEADNHYADDGNRCPNCDSDNIHNTDEEDK